MGWATTPIHTGLFMETIKLERNGKVVVRSKDSYEMNKENFDLRGFKEASSKPKTEPKPEPKEEKPKEEKKPETKKAE